MQKKFTEEKINEILEQGIASFAEKGLDGVSMNRIAKSAGISVGVLYKYYKDKNDFFIACLRKSLMTLENVINEELSHEDKLLVHAEKIIRATQKHSKEHANYIKMYNVITSGNSQEHAVYLAKEIEEMSARIYTDFIERGKNNGDLRSDIDSKMFAFFFDNLLMMIQFAYSCDYYRERFKLYCGEDIFDDDEKVVSELLKFMESAFTFEQSKIHHKK